MYGSRDNYSGHVQILSKVGVFEPDGFVVVMTASTATAATTTTTANDGQDGYNGHDSYDDHDDQNGHDC